MANPNIVNVASILANTAVLNVITSLANVVTNAAGSNTVVKMNNLIVSNYTANNITANVILVRSSVTYYFTGTVTVPSNSTLVVMGKDTGVYLLEGDYVQSNASANNAAHVIAAYEVIS